MIEPAPEPTSVPATPPRLPWWLLAVLLVLAAGAGFGVGALVWAGKSAEQPPPPYPPGFAHLSPEDYDRCIRQVTVHFKDNNRDESMRVAANQLRTDPRFETVQPRTQKEAYEEFKRIFADQSELLNSTRADSLPASVILMVRKGSNWKEVDGALRAQFRGTDVDGQNMCPR